MKLDEFNIAGPGTFTFSAVNVRDLPEETYTLVDILDDVSPSTSRIRQASCDMKKTIIEACKKDARSEYLLIRQSVFGSTVKEVHGYKPLVEIDVNEYKPAETIGHGTALIDAIYYGISSALEYSDQMSNTMNICSNSIVFIITDGMDNESTMTEKNIVEKVTDARASEALDSINTILIGIKDPSYDSKTISIALEGLATRAKLDSYIDAGDATPQKLAKLANWVSKSISSTSQVIGSGGPSQNLAF